MRRRWNPGTPCLFLERAIKINVNQNTAEIEQQCNGSVHGVLYCSASIFYSEKTGGRQKADGLVLRIVMRFVLKMIDLIFCIRILDFTAKSR
jgi:hypothetical protein